MFLLSIKNNIISNILLCILFFLLQIFFPKLFIINGCNIGFDFIIILLTILIFKNESYKIILLALFFGLVQDFIISVEQIGIFCFLRIASVFLIGLIKKYQFIWSYTIKCSALFFIVFFQFLIYFLMNFNELYFFIFYISILNAFLYIVLMALINRIYFNSKLI